MTILFVSSLIGSPIWLLISNKFGKFRAWAAYNLVSAFVMNLLLIPNRGQTILVMVSFAAQQWVDAAIDCIVLLLPCITAAQSTQLPNCLNNEMKRLRLPHNAIAAGCDVLCGHPARRWLSE